MPSLAPAAAWARGGGVQRRMPWLQTLALAAARPQAGSETRQGPPLGDLDRRIPITQGARHHWERGV